MQTTDITQYKYALPSLTKLFAKFTEQKAIDTTAFLGQWPTRYQSNASAADLTVMMDHLDLAGVCVSHIASIHGHDTRSGNEALWRECEADRRLWPFAILNPTEPGWREELAWATSSGAYGVRLLPGFHHYDMDHPEAKALAQAVRHTGLPLQVCLRLQDERLQHPCYKVEPLSTHAIVKLAIDLEGHPLLVSGIREYEWDEIWRQLPSELQSGQILFDLWYCKSPISVIASLCQRGGAGAFVYGSCVPLHIPEATVLQLAAAEISEEERYALSRGNALRFLGLSQQTTESMGIDNVKGDPTYGLVIREEAR
ncbi:amidohydrolase family protein [Paenibacillus sp. HWE-109]|uniref:amidohydrolase family protein n=1 Tax=Paenibacillus sp. HWE-109 TaxID=1306526 RepID=UPI001EDF4F5C|nr:amidohydrolase family protein [Paenibacillus sp. HWE-109]UKS28297.1 amidohydrolase family protein [Paenibacillus sp. HWE-109]